MAVLIKFIALPLYPLGLAIMAQVICVVLFLVKKPKIAFPFLLLSIMVLLVFSSPVVAAILAKSLENRTSAKLPPVGSDATIIVLGGGGVPFVAPRKYPEINDAGDRMLHGARLYKMGVGRHVVTTGGDVGTALFDAPSEAEENAMILREIGVDSSAIIKEHKAKNTHEHPFYIAKTLDSLKVNKTVVLVTTASHMPRAVAVFKKHGGFEIYTAPTDYISQTKIINRTTDIFPNVSALENSTTIIHEYYGVIAYKVFGWI